MCKYYQKKQIDHPNGVFLEITVDHLCNKTYSNKLKQLVKINTCYSFTDFEKCEFYEPRN